MKKLLTYTALAGLMAGSAVAETNFIANSFYDGAVPMSGEGYIRWAELVEELSDGELVPEVFTGTVLLAPRASMQGIQDNVVQVAHHAAVYTPSDLPVSNAVQDLGFAYSDPLTAIFAVAEFSMTNEAQLQEWKDSKLVYLGAYATPAYVLMCSSPVRNLEEMAGKRIRTAGSAVSVWVEDAGGIPVNVPSSEMYTGLERGTLDCATNAASDLLDRSLLEVAEHTTLLSTGMYWSGPQWGYNIDFWATLTPEDRAVLMEASARSMARIVIAYNAKVDAGLAASIAAGGNVYEPEQDLVDHVTTFRAKAAEGAIEKAESAGVADPEALIGDFQDTMQKWADLLAEIEPTDEDALTALAMEEIYSKIDPATYGVE
ncbi:C4-dicarboxylate TRAP transporter substrate-binding protein [Celeribacter halophilus]|uniref:TRAP-type C4-dicarboxylate transport system, substrate-binding protein n=1 Tax=Celeribacter halophilus TaxID=576117 RepID=A0A1I3V9Q5_9RHOB|nr:C4-dicarboxylate TRAP transporter substrate-binding protein [Celeribacter halophilus]PZX09579.1 TRAP-type C4-dicarboxylate transport system substrate-binding protein [Celeribacter halophilus]SFJ91739.1 TRAP-type C4-dicarboxylate transport system, substrate-binding protein [Celeribacter halophilus]